MFKNEAFRSIDKEIIDMIGLKIKGFMGGSSGNMRLRQDKQHMISYLIVGKCQQGFLLDHQMEGILAYVDHR